MCLLQKFIIQLAKMGILISVDIVKFGNDTKGYHRHSSIAAHLHTPPKEIGIILQ